MLSWLSCERYTESMSKDIDKEPLSGWERLRYRFHHIICYNCRRYLKQSKFLERAAPQLFSEDKDSACKTRLSDDARARIEKAVSSTEEAS